MPKAVVLEHLRHIFLELESRQPHAARRAVTPADEQPPEPAEGIGDSPEQEQQQHADSLQKKQQQSADSLEQRNNARRESLQQPIQQGQQSIQQRKDGIAFLFISRFFCHSLCYAV